MPTQRTTQKKSSTKKRAAIKKSTAPSRTKKTTRRKVAAQTTGTLMAPTLSITSADALTMPQEMLRIEPIAQIKESFKKHPEHTMLLIGEYYLIAILFSIIGIACMYGVLALL
ncbi:MAG: hypothetical protein KIH62_000965 [Candidatus Kerfeldbacteria bacterium]|nr:hypothetical protein [Candidatus Kerfeldbacteria bacterium]